MPVEYAVRTSMQLKPLLRAVRKQRGLTQAELGRLLGVSQKRIAQIEKDPSLVSVGQFQSLVLALGATLTIVVDDARSPQVQEAPSPEAW